jgi:peptidoglycan/LPS O-acetylase OafA/YrhL
LCIFLAIERRDWVLNNPVASGIGALSYSLYLWQQPFTLGPGSIPVSLLMLSLFAFLSYVLIEKPMLDLGGRLGTVSRRTLAPTECDL